MGRRAGPAKLAFLGVTATMSSINRVFPVWARELGLDDVVLDPVDLPLDASAEDYRRVVTDLRNDQRYRGALVTTHKVRLLHAARDLFDELDPLATQTHEVSCITKRDGALRGSAKDPITAGRSMEEFLGERHFAGSAEVLCLGAGGSGLAIAMHVATRQQGDSPPRVVLVNRGGERLEQCRAVLDALPGQTPTFAYVASDDPRANDRLVGELPAGSMVVNATGLGKDRPGSPVTDAVSFPESGIAWELNYRGDLDFLHQARAQESSRRLAVEDGWRYFVHGWSEVIQEVFELELTPETVDRLSRLAGEVRT